MAEWAEVSAYPASMIAVAAFCRIVLWLEKKLRRHRRAIATPMFIYLSWKYTIFGLRGLRVGRRGRLRLLPPSVVSLFHMPKEVPTSRSRRFPREKARQTERRRRERERGGKAFVRFQIYEIYHLFCTPLVICSREQHNLQV